MRLRHSAKKMDQATANMKLVALQSQNEKNDNGWPKLFLLCATGALESDIIPARPQPSTLG
jgi:hypothetical protein